MKFYLYLILLSCSFFAFTGKSEEKAEQKQATAVQPAVKIELEGVPNFHQIAPNVYRSAQPTAEGFKNLEKMGIKTIINLRNNHSDQEEAKKTSLQLKRIKINTWDIDDEHVAKVMALLSQKEKGPFLIHCQHGADRTGLMAAMYRIIYQGWSKEDALKELKSDSFGFHSIWRNIPRYIQKVDIETLKKQIDKVLELKKSGKKIEEIDDDDLEEDD